MDTNSANAVDVAGAENSLEHLPQFTEKEALANAGEKIVSKETDPNLTTYYEMQQIKAKEELEKKFSSDRNVFYFKDQGGIQAFKDAGSKITTIHNDPRVAAATVLLAQSKGWEAIKVSGHADYKKEVWLQANLKGIQVEGFKPSEMDLVELDRLRDTRSNQIIHQPILPNGSLPSELQARENNQAQSNGERIYMGELVAHGPAPYQNMKDAKSSYYATLKDQAGNQETIWGVDLQRAIQESGMKIGESANIRYLGNQPVNVTVLDKDSKGAVIGERQIMTKRNTWSVEKNEVVREVAKQVLKGKNVDQATINKIDKAVKTKQEELTKAGRRTPAVRMFDIKAPKVQREKTQKIEREQQRERLIDRSR